MQEKFTVTIIQDHDQQAKVQGNHSELEGEWLDIYVYFSGFFGHHGPHKFAQGPVLYEALEKLLEEFNEQMPGIVHDELMAIMNARAALKLARGEE